MGNNLTSVAGYESVLSSRQLPHDRPMPNIDHNLDSVAEGLAIFLREYRQYQRHRRKNKSKRSSAYCSRKALEDPLLVEFIEVVTNDAFITGRCAKFIETRTCQCQGDLREHSIYAVEPEYGYGDNGCESNSMASHDKSWPRPRTYHQNTRNLTGNTFSRYQDRAQDSFPRHREHMPYDAERYRPFSEYYTSNGFPGSKSYIPWKLHCRHGRAAYLDIDGGFAVEDHRGQQRRRHQFDRPSSKVEGVSARRMHQRPVDEA